MNKLNKNTCYYLIILLFTYLFIFLFIDESFARAGGGGGGGGGFGGGGGGFGGGSSGRVIIDKRITEYFLSIAKKEGFPIALLYLSPIILLNILSAIAISYYHSENRVKRFLIFTFYLIGTIYYCGSLYVLSVILPSQLIFLIYYIYKSIQCGHFFNYSDEMHIRFEKEYKEKEEKVLRNFLNSNPTFSLDNLKKRIINAFKIIQDSWMKQDLTNSEIFLADGTFEQFQIQINGIIDNNYVDKMSDLDVMSVRLVKAEISDNYDSFYVAIQAKAINYLLNLSTREIIKGDPKEPEVFAEIWCFFRRKGVKELNKEGLIEGYCPNCGTQITGSRLIKCPSCEALLKSGQHDWILAGIYQASEWRDTHNNYIPGLRTLYLYDPNFNIQNIEDKLSAYFWRMIEAVRTKKVDPILKISSDSFSKKFIDSFCRNDEFSTIHLAGTDSIEIIGIFRENNKHILLGQIVWNSCSYFDTTRTYHEKTVFLLQRDINAKTDIKKCFSSMHCPNCGAIETSNNNNYCEYCNTISNDDSKDWILINIISRDYSLADSYLEKSEQYDLEYFNLEPIFTNPETKSKQLYNNASNKIDDDIIIDNLNLFGKYSFKDTLRLCIAIMLADGRIDEKEMKIIRKICKKGYISEEKLKQYINEMQNQKNPIDYVLKTAAIELDKDLIKLLIRIAASDGNIDKSESDLIYKVANKMNYPNDDLRQSIDKYTKKKWYQL